MPGRLSGTGRQVDVLVSGVVAGERIVIAVECKRYAKKLGIGSVDEFAGKLLDIGVDRGMLFGLNGLTEPARKRADGARQPRISIGDLVTTEDHVAPDLSRLLAPKFGDCPNENCITGDVRWQWWNSENGSIRAGECDTCGSWAVECPECGEVIDFFTDESPCYSCGTVTATLVNDSDSIGPAEIVVSRNTEMETFRPTSKAAPRDEMRS